MNFEIKNVYSWAVLAALQNNGDMTVKELAYSLDISTVSVRRGTRELLPLGLIVRASTGNGREEVYHAYPPTPPQDIDVRMLCIEADEQGLYDDILVHSQMSNGKQYRPYGKTCYQ